MTLEDIDQLIDIMAKEAADKGDERLLPGAIILSADAYCRLPTGRAACTNILHGIRYRGVRINVARAYEDKVLSRAEAGDRGEPYVDADGRAFFQPAGPADTPSS